MRMGGRFGPIPTRREQLNAIRHPYCSQCGPRKAHTTRHLRSTIIFGNIAKNDRTLGLDMARLQDRNIVLTAAGLQTLARKPLSKGEGAVLWHLASSLPVTGDVVSKAELNALLALSEPQVNRAMKHLCELGFLMRGPKIGVSHHYKLNPVFIRILS